MVKPNYAPLTLPYTTYFTIIAYMLAFIVLLHLIKVRNPTKWCERDENAFATLLCSYRNSSFTSVNWTPNVTVRVAGINSHGLVLNITERRLYICTLYIVRYKYVGRNFVEEFLFYKQWKWVTNRVYALVNNANE